MPNLATRRMRDISICLLALCWGAACGDSPELEPQILLIERIAFAESQALDDSGADSLPRVDGDAFLQKAGTRIRFGFAVPNHAKLIAALGLDEGAQASDALSVRISLFAATDEHTGETILHEETIAGTSDGAQIRIEIDLSPWSEQLVNLELRVTSRAPGPALHWSELRIDGHALPRFSSSTIPRGAYNLLVIVLDSLRADHLSPYGAVDIATPHLAELASKGVVFESARTNATWTRPSVVTMFSSQYPWHHGVLELDSIFPETLPYLPELLAEAGYRTKGASANDMVSALFGMARGFETLYALRKSQVYRASRDPRERARFVWTHLLDPLTAQDAAREGPFFAYLHQLDPHSPYNPATRYRRRFTGTFSGEAMDTSVEHVRHLRARARDLGAEQIDYLGRLYKGEVAFMDDYVGEIVHQLEARDLTRNTLIIFTSDHGEEFFDHQSLGHGHTVYDELLRVPLIMRLDGVLPAGTRVSQPVELIDLAPTVLDLLGLEIPPAMQGQSMLPYIENPSATQPRVSLATSGKLWQFSIGYGDWKLVRHNAIREESKEKVELFDLVRDPKERHDVSSEQPIVTSALRQLLAWHLGQEKLAGKPRPPGAKLDPETLEALKAMGYLEFE